MPRKLRITYPGAIYHVMNCGDQPADIFRDDENRQQFLPTLGTACRNSEWQVRESKTVTAPLHSTSIALIRVEELWRDTFSRGRACGGDSGGDAGADSPRPR